MPFQCNIQSLILGGIFGQCILIGKKNLIKLNLIKIIKMFYLQEGMLPVNFLTFSKGKMWQPIQIKFINMIW